MGTTREKRASQRYPVAYDVEWENGNGVTRDLSIRGVRFFTGASHRFWIGEMLRFFVIVRRLETSMNRLRCEGRVIRIDGSSAGWDVAVCLQNFQFEYSSSVARKQRS